MSNIHLNDKQIEVIADLFSKHNFILNDDNDAEYLLSHAFQLGMKCYRDLANNQSSQAKTIIQTSTKP